jgi:2-polyprenyl-3-methyl-5-hydroxy-6-metoxy-1,4-benzoquinol methylase
VSAVETTAGACPLCGPEFLATSVATAIDFEYGTTGQQEWQFVRCQSCACLLLHPRPVDSAIAGLYPPDYEPYRFDTLPRPVKLGRDLVQRSKVGVIARYAKAGAKIVDVGCGAGAFLRLLKDYGRRDWELWGWDYPGPHMGPLGDAGFSIIEAPISEQNVPSDVDVFVLNQVIEHFPHPDRLLAALGRGLRPGGVILIETPDVDGLDSQWFGTRHWGGYHAPRHMVLFNAVTLRRLVERHGLEAVESARLASPAFWIQSLHHKALERGWTRLASVLNLRNLPLVAGFVMLDASRRLFGPTSNQRLVARRRPDSAAQASS